MAASSPGEVRSARLHYHEFLRCLHDVLKPRTYFEIGVWRGESLAFASCPVVAVNPCPQLTVEVLERPKVLHLFRMTSDEFFAEWNPSTLFPDVIDLAFLDGMHLFEYLLKDFMNTENIANERTVIALHDCCPPKWESASMLPRHERLV